MRQLQARGTARGDERVLDILSDITDIMAVGAAERFKSWQQRVSTRCGAARWVRSKLERQKPPGAPKLDDATFTPDGKADKVAPEFAKRWSGSIWSWNRDDSPNTCFVDSEPILERKSVELPMRARPPLDLTLFDGAPLIERVAPWTPEGVLENMPTGNAGLAGVTVEWLQGLPIGFSTSGQPPHGGRRRLKAQTLELR